MAEDVESLLKIYSMGVVAADRKPNSSKIEVRPVEQIFMDSVSVDDGMAEVEIKHASSNGEDIVKLKIGKSVPALWWKFNSNRVSPPDVKKGDQVIIYRMGETDLYFWVDLNNMNVKDVENVYYAWAADKNNRMADDLSNAWMFNVDTVNGTFTFRTSKSNGEKYAYMIQGNCRTGSLNVKDDIKNGFYLNSEESDVGMYNSYLSKVNINKEECFIHAVKRVKVTTDELEMIYKTKKETGDTSTVTVPKQTHVGDVTIDGDEHITGNWTLDGDGTAKTGRLTAANATIGGSDYNSHTHKAQGEYSETTVPTNLGKATFNIKTK